MIRNLNNLPAVSNANCIASYSSTEVLFPSAKTKNYKPPFEQIFRKYNLRLVRYAQKLLGDHTAAEDIASEVFVKYWNKEDDFINEFAVRSFLDISTRNACLNQIRKTRRHQKREKLLPSQTDECESYILNAIARSEIITEVLKIIESLPEACRRIIMGYIKGFTDKEMASLLNLSEYTVRNHKARGLYLIKEKYKQLEQIIIEHQVTADDKLDGQPKNARYLAVMKALYK